MSETPVLLDDEQRAKIQETIEKHCEIRGWKLHAVNCRSNHCHVVVTANDYDCEKVRDEFKAWCTRKLKELEGSCINDNSRLRERWWTRKGSVRYLFDTESLEAATLYTLEAQDAGGSKGN
jgi:REP element-mobilizing transposase RayT